MTIDVLSNDSDSDGSLDVESVTIIDDPLHGSASVDLSTGEITYVHDGSATTSDSLPILSTITKVLNQIWQL